MSDRFVFAVLSDIHGNRTAFEAVLEDVNRFSPVDGVLVAGDTIGGPSQEWILQRLRALDAVMIRGNWENRVLMLEDHTAPDYYDTASQFSLVRWVQENLSPESRLFLRSLPEQRSVPFQGKNTIRLVHGSPRHVAEKNWPDRIESLDEILTLVSEPVYICGHTHTQWQFRRDGRLAFNPGAVSAPHGCVGAQYTLLIWDGSRWEVELRQVSYNHEAVCSEFQESGFLSVGPLPRLFLHTLLTGEHVEHDFMRAALQMAEAAGLGHLPYIPDEIWDQLPVE